MTDATHPTPERLRELIEFLLGKSGPLTAQEATAACRDAAAALRRLLVLDRAIGDAKDWKREQTRYPDGRVDYVGLNWAILDASREEDER